MDKGKYWEKPDKYHIALDHPSSTQALMNHGSRHTVDPDTAPDATPSADDAPISKTRRKQQMHALQALGERLVKLPAQQLARVLGVLDGIKAEFDAKGAITGEQRFLGLYTSSAYNRRPWEIPG